MPKEKAKRRKRKKVDTLEIYEKYIPARLVPRAYPIVTYCRRKGRER
jgi:hypothetical protein